MAKVYAPAGCGVVTARVTPVQPPPGHRGGLGHPQRAPGITGGRRSVMGWSRWLGHRLTLFGAGSVALAAGAAIAVAAAGVVDPVPGGGGTAVSYPVRQLMIV